MAKIHSMLVVLFYIPFLLAGSAQCFSYLAATMKNVSEFISCSNAERSVDEMSNTVKSFAPPEVLIAVTTEKYDRLLPYLLGFIEQLAYPKHRLALLFSTSDESSNEAPIWLDAVRDQYHSSSRTLAADFLNTASNKNQPRSIDFYRHALEYALETEAQSLLFLHPKCILFQNTSIITDLLRTPGDILAPKLWSPLHTYSNYWCDMTENAEYKISDDSSCSPTHKLNGFQASSAANVHSCFLVQHRKTMSLMLDQVIRVAGRQQTKNYSLLSVAGETAKRYNLSLVVISSAKNAYGIILSPTAHLSKANDASRVNLDELANFLIPLYTQDTFGLVRKTILSVLRPKTKLWPPAPQNNSVTGKLMDDLLHDIFVINLDRRPERMKRMGLSLDILGMPFKRFAAVDGLKLNNESIKALNITFLPDTSIRLGQIGCYLSHYQLWEKIARENDESYVSLILEDDTYFRPFFTRHLRVALQDAKRLHLDWDLLYVGRQKMKPQALRTELVVPGCNGRLLQAEYSWWANGYLLTRNGARKFLAAEPPAKPMIAIDEVMAILSGRHPTQEWNKYFPVQNLNFYAIEPQLLHPLWFDRDDWVTDTDGSPFVSVYRRSNNEQ